MNITEEKKTDEFAIQVEEGVDVDKLAMEHGYQNLGKIGSLDYYLFKKLKKRNGFPSLRSSDSIKFMERQVMRKRYKRMSIPDPLFSGQWHLRAGGVTLDPMPVRKNKFFFFPHKKNQKFILNEWKKLNLPKKHNSQTKS